MSLHNLCLSFFSSQRCLIANESGLKIGKPTNSKEIWFTCFSQTHQPGQPLQPPWLSLCIFNKQTKVLLLWGWGLISTATRSSGSWAKSLLVFTVRTPGLTVGDTEHKQQEQAPLKTLPGFPCAKHHAQILCASSCIILTAAHGRYSYSTYKERVAEKKTARSVCFVTKHSVHGLGFKASSTAPSVWLWVKWVTFLSFIFHNETDDPCHCHTFCLPESWNFFVFSLPQRLEVPT